MSKRQAEPARTCCRRTAHAPIRHTFKWLGALLGARRPRCGPFRRGINGFESRKAPLKGELSLSKKVLTSWWTGKQAPPPLPPSPVSAKNQRFFGRGACKETIFSLENGIFRRKNRPVPTLYICTAFLMEKRQQVEPGTARSKGLRPSRALRGFFDSLGRRPTGAGLLLCVSICRGCKEPPADGNVAGLPE